MPETFDPYHRWLGISPKDQPPNHYRLLGVDLFESDPAVIESAADKQMAHVRTFQTGASGAMSQRLLNEIAAAKVCLLAPVKKAAYDARLRDECARKPAPPSQPRKAEPSSAIDLGFEIPPHSSLSVRPSARSPRPGRRRWQVPAVVAGAAAITIGLGFFALLGSGDKKEPLVPPPAATQAQTKEQPPAQPQPAADTKAAPQHGIREGDSPIFVDRKSGQSPTSLATDPKIDGQLPATPAVETAEVAAASPSAETLEQKAQRVKAALATAQSAADYRSIAVDALTLVAAAVAANKQDLAKDLAATALRAARKSSDEELAKTATLCFLEPGSAPAQPRLAPLDLKGARRPIPATAGQEQALKLVQEAFQSQLAAATTADAKAALAQQFLQKAQAIGDDATAQYVLLTEAGRLALSARDVELALKVIEALGAKFAVDGLAMKIKAVVAMGKAARLPEEFKAVNAKAFRLIEEALTNDQFDMAEQLEALVIEIARKSKDPALLKQAIARNKELKAERQELKAIQARIGQASTILERDPADPAASLAVGKDLCFGKGQWDKGLPLLALGGDATLRDVAVRELKGVKEPVEQVKLADAWWELAEKARGIARRHTEARAAFWYQQALPAATGLVKDKVQQRLQEIATRAQLRELASESEGIGSSRPGRVVAHNVKILVVEARVFEEKLAGKFPPSQNKAQEGVAEASSHFGDFVPQKALTQKRGSESFALSGPQGAFVAKWAKPPHGRYILVFGRPCELGRDAWGNAAVSINGGLPIPLRGMASSMVAIFDLTHVAPIHSVAFRIEGTVECPGISTLEIH